LLLGIATISLAAVEAQSVKEKISSIDSSYHINDLEEVVITAQYAPTDIRNAVHDVRIIDAVEIRKQGFNTLTELLTNQLNLRVDTDPILGNGLRIQGIGGENIQIMIDGVPVIGRQDGNIDLSQINLSNVAQVEIIEGAMSTQFGSNASGGVINIITRQSPAHLWEVNTQHQYESVGILNNSLQVSSRFDKLAIQLDANRYHNQIAPVDSLRLYENRTSPTGETYRAKKYPWNPKLQYGLGAMLRYDVRDSFKIRYQYRLFDEELTSYGEMRRTQFRPYAFDETFVTQRHDHSLHLEVYPTPNLFLNSKTAFNDFRRKSATTRFDKETDATEIITGSRDTSQFTALLHRSILSTINGGILNGQIGIEILHETGKGERIVDSTRRPYDQATITNYAGWASIRLQPVNQLQIVTALRYGYNTQYDHPLIPSLNLAWTIQPAWQLRMSYARGFRAPSLKELHLAFIDANHFILGNTDLKAETSHNSSLSLAYQPRARQRHQLSGKVKLFYNHIQNRIVLAEYAPALYDYQNLERFRTHGVSLNLQYDLGETLTLQAGLAYTRLYNEWAEDHTAPTYTGLYEMQNQLIYSVPFIATQLRLTHRFIGQQIQFFLNSQDQLQEGFIGDYHLLNLTLNRGFWDQRLTVTGGIKNLLDIETVAVLGGGGSVHSSGAGSQLINWGRSYFLQMGLVLHANQ